MRWNSPDRSSVALSSSAMNARQANDDDSGSRGDVLFQQLLELFVVPEMERLQAADPSGEWSAVSRFLILMPPGQSPIVKLNDAFGGLLEVHYTRDCVLGEEAGPADIDGVANFEPDEDDHGQPFIAGFAHSAGWSVVFRLGWQHEMAGTYLRLGQQFAATAREALVAGRTGVALDNAYSASELFAKTVLLSSPLAMTEEVVNSRDQKHIVPRFDKWTGLDNAPRGFTHLLHDLWELRGAARYLNEPLSVGTDEVDRLFVTLGEFEAFAENEINGEPRTSYNVRATRDIRSGELVELDAATIERPRRREPA